MPTISPTLDRHWGWRLELQDWFDVSIMASQRTTDVLMTKVAAVQVQQASCDLSSTPNLGMNVFIQGTHWLGSLAEPSIGVSLLVGEMSG
ncbi:hypothetical protein MKZ38_008640 [Zalerion maritima]|uniref:Uncharacterized protein n=1 Tax=Zalerion maritima TaxID=339359 RepID=A0AAD5WYJ4_9PEZI|nr:hypothetical protein MKZ38_008640 [Zalerion maritima]